MAILFDKKQNKLIYSSIANSEEIKRADQLNTYLNENIPQIESELQDKYKRGSIEFWYYFGKVLRDIIDKFNISSNERNYLWQAIENLSASEVVIRKNRSFGRTNYEYFYLISQYDLINLSKMNWSEWSTFLDSISLRREPRTIKWLMEKLKTADVKKIKRKFYRLLTMGLNSSLKGKDTAMYTYEQLSDRYDVVWSATEYLIKHEPKIKKKDISKLKSQRQIGLEKRKRSKITKLYQKYYDEIFSLMRQNKELTSEQIMRQSIAINYGEMEK